MAKWYNVGDPVSTQRRTDPVHPPKPPGKKDKARWCRGRVGVEHVWEITVPPSIDTFIAAQPCSERSYGLRRGKPWTFWLCKHRVVCSECGKIKRRATRAECSSGVLDPA